MRTTKLAAAAAAASLALVVGGAPALANDEDVIKRGSCSGGTTWKVKAKPDDGRLEVEGEVDSNRSGQKWRWRLVHNGSLSARGKRVTKPPSGSFEVKRRVVDLKGTDQLKFRAKHRNTGEVCVGRLNI